MRRALMFFLIGSIFLSGCWDQRLYKDLSIISVIGVDGYIGDIKAYYAYPSSSDDPTKYIVLDGKGKTAREVRMDANKKSEQAIDIAELTTILFSEDTAKKNLYKMLDVYYRSAQSPMTAKVVLTEGSVKKFLNLKENIPKEIGEYYLDFIKSFEEYSIYPKTNLEIAANRMFSEGVDLGLPYIKISGKGLPEAEGLALFNGQKYTGIHLTQRESLFVTLLGYGKAKMVEVSYLWNKDEEKEPVSFNIIRFKQKKKVTQVGSKIKLSYEIKMPIVMTEYPPNHLNKKEKREPLKKFIEKRIEKDIAKMFKKCQEASSDVVGIGEDIRAYHPDLWKEGKWKELYKDMEIEAKVNVQIERSGSTR